MFRASTLAAGLAAALALAAPASAQLLGPGAEYPCEPQAATAGGTALTCPFGGVRNIVDIEGGTHAYEPDGRLDRGKLRLNLSGGEATDRNTGQLVREAVAINPDVGGCTLIYDGRKTLLASFCPLSFPKPGVRFLTPIQVCDPVCVDPVQQALALEVKVNHFALRLRRIKRLSGRVARLRRQVVALRRAVRNQVREGPRSRVSPDPR